MSKVVRIYDRNAVQWDYIQEDYLKFINQEVADRMVDKGVCALTDEATPEKAWKSLIRNYKSKDKVAIKPNFNNIHHGYKELFTSPQVLNSAIKGLVEYVGVPEKNIYIYDLCRPIPYENMRSRIKYKVNYVEVFEPKSLVEKIKLHLGMGLHCADRSAPIKMSNKIIDKKGNAITCYIPKVITHAQHLINIPILTNHVFISASGPLKNHFGTVRFSNFDSGPRCLHGKSIEDTIVDINTNQHIKGKTRLIIVDALLGIYGRGKIEGIKKWQTFPCDNGIPNSLFFSQDPVATESVISDYIEAERKDYNFEFLSHNYLHFAAEKKLGIHEHRDINERYNQIKYLEY
jgi:uncharacterized protein (DUF362 family)